MDPDWPTSGDVLIPLTYLDPKAHSDSGGVGGGKQILVSGNLS